MANQGAFAAIKDGKAQGQAARGFGSQVITWGMPASGGLGAYKLDSVLWPVHEVRCQLQWQLSCFLAILKRS